MDTFFSKDNLTSLVRPYSEKDPYYRPFILHGKPSQIDLFLLGINPATSIYLKNGVDIETWIKIIMNHELYYKNYSSNGPTRKGIQGLLNIIKQHYPYPIFETNVNAYPTDRAEHLDEPAIQEAVFEGENRFKKVFGAHEPSIIILHGQYTTKHFINLLERNHLIKRRSIKKKTRIEEREKQFPHFIFTYPSGKKCTVFACRHLMYFHEGDSYKNFLDGIIPFLKGKTEIRKY
jgi:hypothetical protein